MDALGQAEELLRQLTRRLELRPHSIKRPQVPTAPGRAGESPPPAGTVLAPGCRLFPPPGRIAFGGHQAGPRASCKCEFLLGALGSVRQSLEQLQPFGEVTDRFHIGRALAGSLPCLLPVGNGLLDQDPPRCSDGPAARAGSLWSRETVLPTPEQSAGDTAGGCS